MKQTVPRLVAAFLLGWLACLGTSGGLSAQAPRSQDTTQPPPLFIGGKPFRIGMPRQEAMALIKECCRTQGPSDAMFLQAKTGDFSIIGSIHFRDDRVSELVSSLKASGGKETSDLALALYRAILNGRESASENVSLNAFSRESTNGTSRNIVLTYSNGRVLRLAQIAVDDGTLGVNLDEER